MTQGPWSDGVPTGWQIRPLWSEFRRGKTLGDGSEELLSVYRDYGVIPKSSRDDNFNKPSEDLSKYQRVSVGDLVVNKMKAWQGSLGISNQDGIVSPAYFVYKATGTFERRFAHYLLRSKEYADHMAAISSGIRPNQWDLDPAQFAVTPLLVPPPAAQRAIADYLDRETAQIDAFIAKNEELTTLLTERRLAAITSAVVTAGVGPTVALRHLTSVLDCKHVTAEPADGDDSFAVASVREVADRWVNVENARRTTADSFRNLGEGGRTLRTWDLLVCRNTSVGKISIVPPGIEPTVMGQDVSLIRTPDADPDIARFLHYVLTSAVGVDGFEQASIGSTFKRINVDDIKALRVPNVSSTTARRISDELDAMTSRVDEAIATAEHGVVLARERRAALISAAVTGKIDVGVAV